MTSAPPGKPPNGEARQMRVPQPDGEAAPPSSGDAADGTMRVPAKPEPARPNVEGTAGAARRRAGKHAAASPQRPVSGHENPARRLPWPGKGSAGWLTHFVLPAFLLLAPAAGAVGTRMLLDRTHVVEDGALLLPDGGVDMVTAIEWAPTLDGPLFAGTHSGNLLRIGRGGGHEIIGRPGDETWLPGVVRSLHFAGGEVPHGLVERRAGVSPESGPEFRAGPISPDGGLYAAVEANSGSAVIGRRGLSKGAPQQTPLGLALVRDLAGPNGPVEVGEVYGIDDVRVLTALPGSATVIAGTGDGDVYAIDASAQISGTSPETYTKLIGGHQDAIVEVAAAPAAGAVVFATRAADRSIQVWRSSPSTGDYVATDMATVGSDWARETIDIGGPWTELLSMSDDGRRILAARGSDGLTLIDLPEPGAEGAPVLTELAQVTSPAALSADGTLLIAADRTNGGVASLDVAALGQGEGPVPEAVTYPALSGRGSAVIALASAGDRFLATTEGRQLFVQFTGDPGRAVAIGGYQEAVVADAISPDGATVAVSRSDGALLLHSAEDGGLLAVLRAPPARPYWVLRFDGSGRRLYGVSDGMDGIDRFSARSGRVERLLPGREIAPETVLFSPDGDRLAYGAFGADQVVLLDLDSGAELASVDIGGNQTRQRASVVEAVKLASDGTASRIAVLDNEGLITLYREAENAARPGPMPAVAKMQLSRDGSALAVLGNTGTVLHADLDGNADPLLRPLALAGPALDIELSPDGGTLVAAGPGGTVDVAEVADLLLPPSAPGSGSRAYLELTGHRAPVTAMALSPDGSLLATASMDGRLRITDLGRARVLGALPFSGLPSGPRASVLMPQPLDLSPHARPDEQAGGGREPVFGAIHGAHRGLEAARSARGRALDAGLGDARIYLRQGYYRSVAVFPTAAARDAALPAVRALSPDAASAYARDLSTWCPGAAERDGIFECELPALTAPSPPAAAN